MLATSTEALMVALGIGRLWRDGFVETIQPPPLPIHIFAQQVMALALQEGGSRAATGCGGWATCYRIWTFVGGRANAMLASALRSAGGSLRTIDNFGITLRDMDNATLAAELDGITDANCPAPVDTRMTAELKFGTCLPDKVAEEVLRLRLSDFGALHRCLQRSRRWIRISD